MDVTTTEVRQALDTAVTIAEGLIRSDYEGTVHLDHMLLPLLPSKIVLSKLREDPDSYLKPPRFHHGQPVKSVKHNHEEVMTFCCLRPGTPMWAIVIRGEGRLSDYPIADLVGVE